MMSEIRVDLRAQTEALGRAYDLVAVYAFGSRALEIAARLAGENPEAEFPGSDLDIGILPARHRHLTVWEKVALAQAIEDLFAVPRVDLVVAPSAPPFLALEIVRGELLYVSDEDAEAEFQLYVLARAGDLAEFQRQRQQMILTGKGF